MKPWPNLDTLTNAERMKIAIQLAKTYRRMNHPDGYSLMSINSFINQLKVDGFAEEEIRYAITRAYTKRVRKYESKEQYSLDPITI
jgi:hypothetical protein